MTRIAWDDSIRLGIAIIDEQHKKLVDTINAFDDAVDEDDEAAFPALLAALEEYAAHHFATEEGYFEQFGYDNAAAHREQHRAFNTYLANYRARYDRNDFLLPNEVALFLATWIKEHVKSSDRKYADCFKAHGLA